MAPAWHSAAIAQQARKMARFGRAHGGVVAVLIATESRWEFPVPCSPFLVWGCHGAETLEEHHKGTKRESNGRRYVASLLASGDR